MDKGGWQKRWLRIVTTVLTLGMMGIIFCFSTEDSTASSETSGKVTETVIKVTVPGYQTFSGARKASIFSQVETIVRKCAHFTEYALLGFFARLCLESWFGSENRRWRFWLLACAFCLAYAATDEWHQLMVDGRSGQVLDVLIDTAGGSLGAGLASGLVLLTERKRRREGGEARAILPEQ